MISSSLLRLSEFPENLIFSPIGTSVTGKVLRLNVNVCNASKVKGIETELRDIMELLGIRDSTTVRTKECKQAGYKSK
jgi:hypothetical protein